MECFDDFMSTLGPPPIFEAAAERAWSRRTNLPVLISAEDLVESARLVLPATIVAKLEQTLKNFEATHVRNAS
jgi:hypothetical protein